MKLRTLLGIGVILVVLSSTAARTTRADVITLEDGRGLEGEVVSETEDEVEIKIPFGATKIPRSRIVKIEKKPSPEQELRSRRAKLGDKDAAGRIELARWALDKRF